MNINLLLPVGMIASLLVACTQPQAGTRDETTVDAVTVNRNHSNEQLTFTPQRVTTIAPFPRGMEMVDGKMYVLCRGRVRGAGGVSAQIEDQAGTLYQVDPEVAEDFAYGDPSEPVRKNGEVFALPASPFKLWDRASDPPEQDRETDRPYCALRYHEATKSFYLCMFSGIDKPRIPGQEAFVKNLTDGIMRYDTRTGKWYEVERHKTSAGGNYPHHDPVYYKPPHGWLNGPDNCLVVGNSLYAVAKDNSVLIRYDLTGLIDDPEAGCPESEWVLGSDVWLKGGGRIEVRGHSALAYDKNYLYMASRTSSHIIRLRLDANGLPVKPVEPELVARFQPYDPGTGKTANLTDMAFDSKGYLYVISAQPSRVYRFKPDPTDIYDAQSPEINAYLDFAAATGNEKMKSENIFIDDKDRLYVTSGDGYGYQAGAKGTVYKMQLP